LRRPTGVLIAATVLGVLTAFGLLGILGIVAVAFFIHNPNIPNQQAFKFIMAVFGFGDMCYCIFCGLVVAGLFRMRNWARISIVILGGLKVVFWGLMSVFMLALRNLISAGNSPAGPLPRAATVFVTVLYGALALVGLWWVVYFNLKHVRVAFKKSKNQEQAIEVLEGSRYTFWQVVVIVLACCSLLASIVMLGIAWTRGPMWVLGVVLRGKVALVAALLLAAVELYAGIGLLLKKRSAYWTAIGLQAYAFLTYCIALIPRFANRIWSTGVEMNQRFGLSTNTRFFYGHTTVILLINIFNLALVTFFLYALLRCRNIYNAQADVAILDVAND
jgi:hypothetical protein